MLGTTYETFDELILYCRQVAGSIGRLCLAIFTGATERDAGRAPSGLADDLGVAMQLTNILRDVREDRDRGPRVPARRGSPPVRLRGPVRRPAPGQPPR